MGSSEGAGDATPEQFGAGILVVALATAAGARAADDTRTPRARLAEIEAAQKVLFEQYSAEIQKVEQTEKGAGSPGLSSGSTATSRRMSTPHLIWRVPTRVIRLRFSLSSSSSCTGTTGRGPGDGSSRALRMILERGDVRAAGQGNYLATVGLTLRQYSDAEKVLRGVLDENPSRSERG